jgi:hypothetical protein
VTKTSQLPVLRFRPLDKCEVPGAIEEVKWNNEIYPSMQNKNVCERDINHAFYKLPGYHSNELSSVNALHECKLCSVTRMSKQSLFYSVMSFLKY